MDGLLLQFIITMEPNARVSVCLAPDEERPVRDTPLSLRAPSARVVTVVTHSIGAVPTDLRGAPRSQRQQRKQRKQNQRAAVTVKKTHVPEAQPRQLVYKAPPKVV